MINRIDMILVDNIDDFRTVGNSENPPQGSD